MQHLRLRRLHPRALTRRQDDDMQIGHRSGDGSHLRP
jgi:hypothetical protein